jgi:mannitol-1-phosphate 5-dehydrogenase
MVNASKEKKAVVYGAGNIGRGFIGETLSASGYAITFLDVAQDIVDALNEAHAYPVRIVTSDSIDDVVVEGVRAIDASDTSGAIEAIAEADLMATAVGVRALPHIAPVIAEGLKKKFASDAVPFNIIVCENLINAAEALKAMVRDTITAASMRAAFDAGVGFVDASIGRMVPPQTEEMKDGNPLRVCVEPYDFLPVDKDSFVEPIPDIRRMEALGNFDFYHRRKLYIHNLGHLCCALQGSLKGYVYIHESVNDAEILCITENAMIESARALSIMYDMPLDSIIAHIDNLLYRFANTALRDTCARVAADLERKLGRADRLIGSALCCAEHDLPFGHIALAGGLALKRLMNEKKKGFSRALALATLSDIIGENTDSKVVSDILDMYDIASENERGSEVTNIKAMHQRAVRMAGNRLIL